MAEENIIKIPRISDTKIIDFFKKLCTEFGFRLAVFEVNPGVTFNEIHLLNEESYPEEFKTLMELDSSIISRCITNDRGLRIVYNRGGVKEKSSFSDELQLTWNQPPRGQPEFNKNKIMQVNALISKELIPFDKEKVASQLPEEEKEAYAFHHELLSRLEVAYTEMMEGNTQYRNQVDLNLIERQQALEQEYKDKNSKLEEANVTQLNEIKNQRAKLEAERKEFDERNNTVVRRAIRDKMLEDVKDRVEEFGVSKSTSRKRLPVLLGMVIFIFSIGILLGSTIYVHDYKSLTQSSEIDYYYYGKTAILTFVFLSSFLYFIKWQDNWASQHANLEFELQQFHLDVNRANWIIESCLEWTKGTSSEVPEPLLESISRNLFKRESDKEDKVIHPSDQLASALLGTSSKLCLDIAGNKLEVDPRKIPKKEESK